MVLTKRLWPEPKGRRKNAPRVLLRVTSRKRDQRAQRYAHSGKMPSLQGVSCSPIFVRPCSTSFSRTRHHDYKQGLTRDHNVTGSCLPRPFRRNTQTPLFRLHPPRAVLFVPRVITSLPRSSLLPSSRSCGSARIRLVQTLYHSRHLRDIEQPRLATGSLRRRRRLNTTI